MQHSAFRLRCVRFGTHHGVLGHVIRHGDVLGVRVCKPRFPGVLVLEERERERPNLKRRDLAPRAEARCCFRHLRAEDLLDFADLSLPRLFLSVSFHHRIPLLLGHCRPRHFLGDSLWALWPRGCCRCCVHAVPSVPSGVASVVVGTLPSLSVVLVRGRVYAGAFQTARRLLHGGGFRGGARGRGRLVFGVWDDHFVRDRAEDSRGRRRLVTVPDVHLHRQEEQPRQLVLREESVAHVCVDALRECADPGRDHLRRIDFDHRVRRGLSGLAEDLKEASDSHEVHVVDGRHLGDSAHHPGSVLPHPLILLRDLLLFQKLGADGLLRLEALSHVVFELRHRPEHVRRLQDVSLHVAEDRNERLLVPLHRVIEVLLILEEFLPELLLLRPLHPQNLCKDAVGEFGARAREVDEHQI
mmetsp:Transcript_58452/g.139644  ORF Transcript_58452/g.139644 Transcript_58452/m.139644 type:complete len:413 (-) Transcript_58452:3118-4356(-)